VGGGGGNTEEAHIAVSPDDVSDRPDFVIDSSSTVAGEAFVPDGIDPTSVLSTDELVRTEGIGPGLPPAIVSVRLPVKPNDDDRTFSGGVHTLPPGVYGDIVVENNARLELEGNALNKYVFDTLKVDTNGEVRLPSSEADPCKVYIDKTFEMVDGAIVNGTGDPALLQFYLADSEGTAPPINFQDQGRGFQCMVYAPTVDILLQNSELTGLVGGKNVSLVDSTIVYPNYLQSEYLDPWNFDNPTRFIPEIRAYRSW